MLLAKLLRGRPEDDAQLGFVGWELQPTTDRGAVLELGCKREAAAHGLAEGLALVLGSHGPNH